VGKKVERGKLILYSHSFRPTRPLYEIDSTLVAFGTTFLYKLQMISGYCTVSWKIRHGIRNSIGLKGTETKKNKEIEDRKCLLNLSKKKNRSASLAGKEMPSSRGETARERTLPHSDGGRPGGR